MTEDNNILISDFFKEAREMEIEDNGFSLRVVRSLPRRADRHSRRAVLLSRLWLAFCVVLGIVLSFVFHVWELLAVHIEVLARTLPFEQERPERLLSLMLVAASLIGLYIYKALDSDELRV